jgi:hypothetical protein
MLWRLALIAFAGCGRIGFEVASQPSDGRTGDGMLSGHDEDGDGVPDSIDVCPHLADNQADLDGDGVGNGCDPNFMTPGDRIAVFATMQPGTQPFTINTATTGTLTQADDSLNVGGDLTGGFYMGLSLPITAGDVRVDIGFDITAVGSASSQHQFAVATTTITPNYFGELNENIGSFSGAYITHFDGTNYNQAAADNLATGIHPGPVQFVLDERVNTFVRIGVAWPGEPYGAQVNDNLYQASDLLQININNLQLEIRYVIVITSP